MYVQYSIYSVVCTAVHALVACYTVKTTTIAKYRCCMSASAAFELVMINGRKHHQDVLQRVRTSMGMSWPEQDAVQGHKMAQSLVGHKNGGRPPWPQHESAIRSSERAHAGSRWWTTYSQTDINMNEQRKVDYWVNFDLRTLTHLRM